MNGHEVKARHAEARPHTRSLLLAYALAVTVLALFALSLLRPQATVVSETDVLGNSYQGTRDAVNGDFREAVQIDFASGAAYLGEVARSGFSGQATYNGAESWTISGVFAEGYLEGEGYYEDARGSYQGHFAHSLPNGKGIYSSKEGWHYEGDFRAGVVTGEGALTFADGKVLEGRFENGVFLEV